MSLADRLLDQGIELSFFSQVAPECPTPNVERCGDVVRVSNQVPISGKTVIAGKVGPGGVTVTRAAEAAALGALNALCAATSVVEIEHVVGVKSLRVDVNVTPGFEEISSIAEGANYFLIGLFGHENDEYDCTVVGVEKLPGGAMVAITLEFFIR